MDCCDSEFIMVLCGFIIAFILAFGIGANDVANSFGTSVGSKVLTLKQACILATIFEILGSILIGAKVSGTIRKGIIEPSIFAGSEKELMLGYVSALVGCCIWLILATILNLPVSGTHSIVGATIGMAIVSRGIGVIKGDEILKIVASWFISPLLSGIVSLLLFIVIRKFILRAADPLKAGLKFLPFIYTLTIVINVGGILESSPPLLGFDKIPGWGKIIIAVGIAITVYLSVWLIMVPYMKKKVEKTLSSQNQQQDESNLLGVKNAEELKFLNSNNDGVTGVENNQEAKKTIGTQVDYVALIMMRNSEDWRNQDKLESEEEHMIKKQQREDQSTDAGSSIIQSKQQLVKRQQHQNVSHPQSSITIHSDPMYKNFNKRNRIRLDSAPSSALKDGTEYEDVNFTLSGYLHTIHSPAFRQLMSLRSYKGNNPQLPTITQGAPATAGSDHVPSFSKIFLQNVSNANEGVDNKLEVDQIKELDAESDKNKTKKFGRFISVPAKFQHDVDQNINASSQKIKDPITEIDAEVEENINELPQKEQKQITDNYAHTDPPEAAKLFSFLQVLTAVFGSFAHGGNDVSNAIGPLIGLYLIYQEGKIMDKANTPEWILFYGGVGISAGLWILGRRVIKTIGEDLTKITPSSGFVIELSSAMTVLGASLINIPVSTTHCKVGSVVFTGRVRSKQSVDWSLFRNIIIAWIVTVPVTGSIAAACQFALKSIFITN